MAGAAIAIRVVSPMLYTLPRRIRIVIVDGQQLVQEGLAAMINRQPDMAVVAVASTAAEAIEEIARHRPDLVTLDLHLPDMPGEILARRIRADYPQTRIVAITSARGHVAARRALDAGVHGYLSKSVPVTELVRAIRRVQAGERIVPGPVACRDSSSAGEDLTASEIRILRLAAWGNGNRQVAAQLAIGCQTVRLHMKRILEKLGARDRAHAVTIALTRGILPLGDWRTATCEGR
jgi:DNA-binding NarL/FixJ family response regulator